MNVRLRMYEYCYSNLGAVYAKVLLAYERSGKNNRMVLAQ